MSSRAPVDDPPRRHHRRLRRRDGRPRGVDRYRRGPGPVHRAPSRHPHHVRVRRCLRHHGSQLPTAGAPSEEGRDASRRAFVTAHATEATAADLSAWSPRLRVWFPCDLGFDRRGITSWSTRDDGRSTPIALRSEVLGFDVFSEPTPHGVAHRWGIVVHLAPRSSGPGAVHLWVADDQPAQDEYAMRRMIRRIESALGPTS